MKKQIPSALFVLAFLTALVGCGEPRETTSSAAVPSQAPVPVKVVAVTKEDLPVNYEATGTVRSRASANISAKLTSYVRELRVAVGDHVREGQFLLALDTRDLDAASNRVAAARDEIQSSIAEAESAVASAKANLDLVQATFRRMNELYGKKSISDQEFDEASARVKAAQSTYNMAQSRRKQLDARIAQADQDIRAAQVMRSYAVIEAPFDGIVTAKTVELGNLAIPGAPLLTIERETYRLEINIDESKLNDLRVGKTASARIDGMERTFDVRVSEIAPSVDAASRTLTVKLDLPSSTALRTGLFGRAAFVLGTRPVSTIPAAAVVERGQLQSVFVAEGGFAHTRLVTTGARVGHRVEVLSGLGSGEQVIWPGPSLTENTRIEVGP